MHLICLIAPTMAGKGKRISKCGGGWIPSVGLSPPPLSLTQLLLTAKRFCNHALRLQTTSYLAARCSLQSPKQELSKLVHRGRLALASIILRCEVCLSWWVVGYGLESVWCTLECYLTLATCRFHGLGSRVQGPGLSRPEDFGKHPATSSFGGSFDFLAFGPRW